MNTKKCVISITGMIGLILSSFIFADECKVTIKNTTELPITVWFESNKCPGEFRWVCENPMVSSNITPSNPMVLQKNETVAVTLTNNTANTGDYPPRKNQYNFGGTFYFVSADSPATHETAAYYGHNYNSNPSCAWGSVSNEQIFVRSSNAQLTVKGAL